MAFFGAGQQSYSMESEESWDSGGSETAATGESSIADSKKFSLFNFRFFEDKESFQNDESYSDGSASYDDETRDESEYRAETVDEDDYDDDESEYEPSRSYSYSVNKNNNNNNNVNNFTSFFWAPTQAITQDVLAPKSLEPSRTFSVPKQKRNSKNQIEKQEIFIPATNEEEEVGRKSCISLKLPKRNEKVLLKNDKPPRSPASRATADRSYYSEHQEDNSTKMCTIPKRLLNKKERASTSNEDASQPASPQLAVQNYMQASPSFNGSNDSSFFHIFLDSERSVNSQASKELHSREASHGASKQSKEKTKNRNCLRRPSKSLEQKLPKKVIVDKSQGSGSSRSKGGSLIKTESSSSYVGPESIFKNKTQVDAASSRQKDNVSRTTDNSPSYVDPEGIFQDFFNSNKAHDEVTKKKKCFPSRSKSKSEVISELTGSTSYQLPPSVFTTRSKKDNLEDARNMGNIFQNPFTKSTIDQQQEQDAGIGTKTCMPIKLKRSGKSNVSETPSKKERNKLFNQLSYPTEASESSSRRLTFSFSGKGYKSGNAASASRGSQSRDSSMREHRDPQPSSSRQQQRSSAKVAAAPQQQRKYVPSKYANQFPFVEIGGGGRHMGNPFQDDDQEPLQPKIIKKDQNKKQQQPKREEVYSDDDDEDDEDDESFFSYASGWFTLESLEA